MRRRFAGGSAVWMGHLLRVRGIGHLVKSTTRTRPGGILEKELRPIKIPVGRLNLPCRSAVQTGIP
jgi:hypothetical protein